jgi:MFS family permease
MVVLDATIVNVALPHVQRALGFSGSGLEWVVNAYAVTFGGLLLLGGFATSQWWLLTARAVQGAGGAVIAPTALALITTNFPPRRACWPNRLAGRAGSTRPARSPPPAASRCSSTACRRRPRGPTGYRTGVARRCWRR